MGTPFRFRRNGVAFSHLGGLIVGSRAKSGKNNYFCHNSLDSFTQNTLTINLMNTRSIFYLVAISMLAAGRSMAAGQDATVTESVNVVNHGSSQSAASAPAPKGTDIRDGEYVETGSASRAELQFANKTISRLGANTIFNYSASSNEVDLQAGTILFSKPKDGKQLNIKTEAVTAAIVGTTGFMQVLHHNGHS